MYVPQCDRRHLVEASQTRVETSCARSEQHAHCSDRNLRRNLTQPGGCRGSSSLLSVTGAPRIRVLQLTKSQGHEHDENRMHPTRKDGLPPKKWSSEMVRSRAILATDLNSARYEPRQLVIASHLRNDDVKLVTRRYVSPLFALLVLQICTTLALRCPPFPVKGAIRGVCNS